MTARAVILSRAVIPAQAGIHDVPPCWIPAFAGMTAE
jgi:hypothetical protein